jgi:5-methylcytosine-specific restriction protein A
VLVMYVGAQRVRGMPCAPKRPCSQPGCMKLNCVEHAKAKRQAWQKRTDSRRGSAHYRGYDQTWKSLRDWFIRENPLCRDPFKLHVGIVTAGMEVDHITPFKGIDDPLRLDWNNLQSLCSTCHKYKTAKLDGGFGNQTQ